MIDFRYKHGGNIYSYAKRLRKSPCEIIDSSASLVPFSAPNFLIDAFISNIKDEGFRYYPEKDLVDLKEAIGKFHNINPASVMPGNGASELITWIGYEAALSGMNCLPIPGFVDYERSLDCWNANYTFHELPKEWNHDSPEPFPIEPAGDVLWITNPHNPTGQLWRKESLKKIIGKYKLVICDEAFLSITPNGERESLIPLVKDYENLFVIRSMTKLFNIAGLRLGYLIGAAEKLETLNSKRDPWPLNSFAILAGLTLFKNEIKFQQWTNKIHQWVVEEKSWLRSEFSKIENLKVHNSSTNFFLIESKYSLLSNIDYLAQKGILIRECTSFKSLDEKWARISLQNHSNNEIVIKEFQNSLEN